MFNPGYLLWAALQAAVPNMASDSGFQILVTAAFALSVSVGTYIGITVRSVDKKIDSIVQVLFGPPESKEADGLVQDVKTYGRALELHRRLIDGQSLALADLAEKLRNSSIPASPVPAGFTLVPVPAPSPKP